MDVIEAIKSRKSVRAFRSDPLPKSLIEELLAISSRSPSWANTQPWEVAVLGGEVLSRVKDALAEKFKSEEPPNPDIPMPEFPDPYNARIMQTVASLYGMLGVTRDDKESRHKFSVRASRFFEAPNALIFFIDGRLGTWSILDMGIFMQTVMISAVGLGLGTCPEAMVVFYPDVLRKILNIPDTKKMICGMALGYPDTSSPLATHKTTREEVDAFVTWHGV